MKIAAAQWNARKKPKRNKYNRSPPEDRTWNGVVYDSKAEMVYHQMSPWTRHHPGAVLMAGGIKYEPDFWDELNQEYVEVKGKPLPTYNQKMRLYVSEPRPFHVREVKAVYRNGVISGFATTRIIVPGQPVPRVARKKKARNT